MEKRKLSLWVPIAVIAAALLMLAVSTGTVDAAPRSGKGGGKGHNGTTTTATCSVAPNPSAWGSTVTISGSGFPAYYGVGITVRGPNGEGPQVGFASADATGRFSTTWSATWLGTNSVTASGGSALATCTFQVF